MYLCNCSSYFPYVTNRSILIICVNIITYERKNLAKHNHQANIKRTDYLQELGYNVISRKP